MYTFGHQQVQGYGGKRGKIPRTMCCWNHRSTTSSSESGRRISEQHLMADRMTIQPFGHTSLTWPSCSSAVIKKEEES